MATEELMGRYDVRLKLKEEIDAMSISRVASLYETLRCKIPNLDAFEEIKYQLAIERLEASNSLPESDVSDSKCGSKFNWLWLLLPALLLWRK